MCGLAGFILERSGTLAAADMRGRAGAMIDMLRHRGPDGSRVWSDDFAGLAHARLSIIDTSDAAFQPMHDDERETHVIFNGEIYNYLDLRRELEGHGFHFANSSDTEVIVHGYRLWGDAVIERLSGMFAIVIWDSRRKRALFARDRFGEKPLYFARRPDAILFGSEIKAILAWPGMPRQPCKDQLHHYLTFGFCSGSRTAFEGIERLPPATVMVLEPGKAPVSRIYWSLPPSPTEVTRKSDDLQHELIERLAAAVKGCLISDVPLGAFLSGGVDSSAVVAMMSRHGGMSAIKTFSSGFGYGDYDETEYAEMVAGRYGTDHHTFRFGVELLGHVGKLAWHYDEPFSDSSAVVAYALARETRQHVTVALTGDGADETFLGYERYFTYGDMRRARPPGGRRRYPQLYRGAFDASDERQAATDAYGFMLERFREVHKLQGYDLGLLINLRDCAYERLLPYFIPGAAPEEQAARYDMGVYLPDDLLVKIDIAAMAHGLETRAPFLNHELAAFAAGIPAGQRIWDRTGKALLKKALEPHLPRECMYRTKVGFRVPVKHFIREQAARQTDHLLLSGRFHDRGFVRPAYVRDMLAAHREGREEHGTRLWALMMLELWHRTWIDRDSNAPLSGDDDPFAELASRDGAARLEDWRGETLVEEAA